MLISDLQIKDIVNIKDGKRLGKIIDIEINDQGIIEKIIIEPKKNIKLFNTRSSDESIITFKQIIKIGEDVILVDL